MTTAAHVSAHPHPHLHYHPILRVVFIALFALALTMVCAGVARAQESVRVPVTPDSKLWIDGTSNLHSWSCKAEKFDAAVEFDVAAAAQLASAPPKALKKVEVKVPVKALKCGHGGMDDNLYKALNADRAPDVTYILGTFDAVPGDSSTMFALQTQGTLSIAGKENALSMQVFATRLADGSVKATGAVTIKMTDYGINPPTAIFGRLKTGNDVKVNFELTVGGKAIANALDQR